ncbi:MULTISPECIES: DUF4113 domain-containing protein [Spirosoma]|uniref:DUF4113 domain-containing protein n=1 Tax=Spirosoma TaxID=107 RepID=UPI003518DA86
MRYTESARGAVYRFGYNYQKIGIILSNFVPADHRQQGIFVEGPNERLLTLSGVIDRLNARHGRDRVRLASQSFTPDWGHRSC